MWNESDNGRDNRSSDEDVRPVYSTRDYDKRNVPPPPPPATESDVRQRVRRRRMNKRSSNGEWAWVIVAAALFSVVLVITFGALIVVQSPAQAEVIPTADVSEYLPTAVVARSEFDGASGSGLSDEVLVLPDGSSMELIPWDGESRFTMIMVGLDRRPGETGMSYRTDSMMLVSIDPTTRQIGILSIPRDLYVQIPGYSSLQRINAAMVLGEQQRAGYGSTLLMQTVQLNLGIRVNDYMAVDFQAFIEIVDAVGGITVETDYVINDPRYPSMNYGYDPFYLPPGEHQLNGYDALRFARTRHGDSDIQRAERQQQVLYAIRDKVLSLDMLPSLVGRSPQLWQTLDDNVYTGLSLEQVVQLALFVRDVPRENISTGVINYRYLQSYTTSSGASVLIPNRARLGELMVDVFGATYSQ